MAITGKWDGCYSKRKTDTKQLKESTQDKPKKKDINKTVKTIKRRQKERKKEKQFRNQEK